MCSAVIATTGEIATNRRINFTPGLHLQEVIPPNYKVHPQDFRCHCLDFLANLGDGVINGTSLHAQRKSSAEDWDERPRQNACQIWVSH